MSSFDGVDKKWLWSSAVLITALTVLVSVNVLGHDPKISIVAAVEVLLLVVGTILFIPSPATKNRAIKVIKTGNAPFDWVRFRLYLVYGVISLLVGVIIVTLFGGDAINHEALFNGMLIILSVFFLLVSAIRVSGKK